MREVILKLLKQHDRVSGQKIASQLNISRSAVWKHIRTLRQKGYSIKSSPRSGYKLVHDTERIVPEAIAAELSTSVIGKKILYYQEVTSTQDVADKLARSGVEEGTVVIAELQSKGRGRKGRNWVSGKNGVYLSIILKPNLKPVHVVQIPMVAGVALAKAIQKVTGLKPRIKWPNDIIIEGKKVSGILTEINCEMDKVNYIITGIGVNVNTSISALPGEIKTVAVSLKELCGKKISRIKLIQVLLEEFDSAYDQFVHLGFAPIAEQWKKLNNTLGSDVRIFDSEVEITGKALNIDEEGFLIIKSDSGEVIKIMTGDVSLRNK